MYRIFTDIYHKNQPYGKSRQLQLRTGPLAVSVSARSFAKNIGDLQSHRIESPGEQWKKGP